MDLATEQHGECAQVDDDTADQVGDLGGVILGGQEGAADRDLHLPHLGRRLFPVHQVLPHRDLRPDQRYHHLSVRCV